LAVLCVGCICSIWHNNDTCNKNEYNNNNIKSNNSNNNNKGKCNVSINE